MSLHMVDVRDLPERHYAAVRRGRWMVAGGLLTLLLLYAVMGTLDFREAERAELARQLASGKREAFNAGWQEGAASVACMGGFRVDKRTGESLR